MVNLENVVFALGPGDRYLYSSPCQTAYNNLPPQIQSDLDCNVIKSVHAAAFGPAGSYFLNYWDGFKSSIRWERLPQRLSNWLNGVRARPKVTIGSDVSFFAWDMYTFCWQSLPPVLEEAIQGWITTAGWGQDCPRWVTLGVNGSFMAITNRNSCAVGGIAVNYPSLKAWIDLASPSAGGMNGLCTMLHSIWRHPFQQDVWATVFNDSGHFAQSGGSSTITEVMRIVGTSISDPEGARMSRIMHDNKKAYEKRFEEQRKATEKDKANRTPREDTGRKQRERAENKYKTRERAEKARHNSEQNAQQERSEKARREEKDQQSRASKEASNHAEPDQKPKTIVGSQSQQTSLTATQQRAKILYKPWVSLCETSIANITTLAIFPHIPDDICICEDIVCLADKLASAKLAPSQGGSSHGGCTACVHDVELLLRSDPDYSVEWLKRKRNMWHSDKWARTPVDVRREFGRLADGMFKIYGMLMERERERGRAAMGT